MQSKNRPKIKLVTNSGIRLIHQIPSTLSDLYISISQLTPTCAYTLTTNTGKLLNTDKDLQECITQSQTLPSLKIFLAPLPCPKCSICSNPSFSPIYNCPECNIFLCPFCESQAIHPHALIKARTLSQILNFSVDRFNPKGFLRELKRFEKNFLKAKVFRHFLSKNFEAVCGETVACGWVIGNCGDLDWPAGCALVWKKGEIKSNGLVFGPVKIGESCELRLEVRVPERIGEYFGYWEVYVRGYSILILKESIKSV